MCQALGPDPGDIKLNKVDPTLKELRLYWESEKWEVHYRTVEVLTQRRARGIW